MQRAERLNVEIPRLHRLEGELSRAAVGVATRLAAGKIDTLTAIAQFKGALHKAETEAYACGVRASGRLVDSLTHSEKRMLSGRHSRQMKYWCRFVRQIQAGTTKMPVQQRAALYGKSLWSLWTRGDSAFARSDPAARYHWHLNPHVENCVDCVAIYMECLRKGGFTLDEMLEHGWPGERDTECQSRCHCYVIVGKVRTPVEMLDRATSIGAQSSVDQRDVADALEELANEYTKAAEKGDYLLSPEGAPQTIALPVAGGSYVAVPPYVAAQIPANSYMAVAKALVSPDKVTHALKNQRVHTSGGLSLTIEDSGLWWILLIIATEARDEEERKKKEAEKK
jgi:hypothetical protein